MTIEAQADLAENFVRELVRCFGITASTSSSIRDDAVHVTVEGTGVGILIGSRGSTIDALQELNQDRSPPSSDEYPTRIHRGRRRLPGPAGGGIAAVRSAPGRRGSHDRRAASARADECARPQGGPRRHYGHRRRVDELRGRGPAFATWSSGPQPGEMPIEPIRAMATQRNRWRLRTPPLRSPGLTSAMVVLQWRFPPVRRRRRRGPSPRTTTPEQVGEQVLLRNWRRGAPDSHRAVSGHAVADNWAALNRLGCAG